MVYMCLPYEHINRILDMWHCFSVFKYRYTQETVNGENVVETA